MIARRVDPCALYRASLIEFVDGRERGPDTIAALRHLDRCRACELELTDIALAIAALRRLGRDLAAVEAPRDAWPTLRSRLARPRRPALMSPITGMALAMAIVAAVVGPPGLTGERLGAVSPVPADPSVLEERFVTAGRHGPLARLPVVNLGGGTMLSLPDGIIKPQQKEVATARVSGRPVTPS